MTRFALIAALMVALVAAAPQPEPDFSLRDLDGHTVRLTDLRGKVVVIDFWATWCGPCLRAVPIAADTVKRLRNDSVIFLAVNVDDNEKPEQLKDFVAQQGWKVRVLPEGYSVKRSFGVGAIPHAVVIGRDGTVVSKHVGISDERHFRDGLSKSIAQALRR